MTLDDDWLSCIDTYIVLLSKSRQLFWISNLLTKNNVSLICVVLCCVVVFCVFFFAFFCICFGFSFGGGGGLLLFFSKYHNTSDILYHLLTLASNFFYLAIREAINALSRGVKSLFSSLDSSPNC